MRRASGRIAPTGGGSRPMAEFRDLLLPGGQHAGEALDPEAFLDSLLRVERAWVMAQAETGILDSGWAEQVAAALGAARDYDLPGLAAEAEAGGNPVIGLVCAARERVRGRLGGTEFPDGADSDPGAWVHRGLTSQDVMDTALMLRMRAGTERILAEVTAAGDALAEIAQQQARTPMIARTLAQHALPTTFGARAGGWLDGLAEARAELTASLRRLPVAIGGAAGTGAQLPRDPRGGRDPQALLAAWARRLGLALPAAPWHTRRQPVLAAAQAPALTAQCFARIGGDVVVSARREIGELSEPAAPGRGGSSAMAHKRNPVLSVLMRRSGLAAALAMGRLHECAALALEERSDVAWHLEWEPLREVLAHGMIAAALGRRLLEGLEVHPEPMARNLALTFPEATDTDPEDTGTYGDAVNLALAAARRWRGGIAPDEPATRGARP